MEVDLSFDPQWTRTHKAIDYTNAQKKNLKQSNIRILKKARNLNLKQINTVI